MANILSEAYEEDWGKRVQCNIWDMLHLHMLLITKSPQFYYRLRLYCGIALNCNIYNSISSTSWSTELQCFEELPNILPHVFWIIMILSLCSTNNDLIVKVEVTWIYNCMSSTTHIKGSVFTSVLMYIVMYNIHAKKNESF